MKRLAVFLMICWLPAKILAHSNVTTTSPENGAEINTAPENISFQMSKPVRITEVTLYHEGNADLPLDISRYKDFQSQFSFPIKPMGTGVYIITWRALGQDGHALTGEFNFIVRE